MDIYQQVHSVENQKLKYVVNLGLTKTSGPLSGRKVVMNFPCRFPKTSHILVQLQQQ